jgi:hypothetical protein
VALTIKEIENAKPKDKKYKLADGGGLCLLIQPWGGKFWLWRYLLDRFLCSNGRQRRAFRVRKALAVPIQQPPAPGAARSNGVSRATQVD